MVNPRRDDVEALLYGAELLDSGVDGETQWSDAVIRRFGEKIGMRLPAIRSMARELRLHPPDDRPKVAAAMLEHREAAGPRPDASPSQGRALDGASTLIGAFSAAGQGNRAIEAQPLSDAVVIGRRGSLISLIMSGLLCAVLALLLLQNFNLIIVAILFYLGHGFYRQLIAYLNPPWMSVRGGVFSIRLDTTVKTAAENLSYLGLDGGKLRIGFRDAARVDFSHPQSPPAMPPGMPPGKPSLGRQGIELTTSGNIFTLDKINKIRRALGQPEQAGDANPDQISQFHAALDATTPYAFVTPTIVVANVAVFAAMWLLTGAILLPNVETLVQWGANCSPETTTGQWWRLFTSMFVHVGILHILFNMWVLWGIGRLVEKLVGNVAFAVSYLAAGFLGSVASVLWNDGIVSAGASGAVFGVFGLLVGFMSLHRKSIPIEAIKQHRNAALAFLAFNLFFGIQWQLFRSEGVPGIDMAAHLGGLVVGFICGLLLSQEISAKAIVGRWVRTAVVTVLAVAACGASVYFLPVRAGDLRYYDARIDGPPREIYNETLKQLKRKSILPAEARARIERDIVAEYARRERKFEQVAAGMRKPDPEFDRLLEYVRLRREGWSLKAEAFTHWDPRTEDKANQVLDAADDLARNGEVRTED